LQEDEARHEVLHDRIVEGCVTKLGDGYHFATHLSVMALQELVEAVAREALQDTQYDHISFTASRNLWDQYETISAITVRDGRVRALLVTRMRTCDWKAALSDPQNPVRLRSHRRRTIDMIWVLKKFRLRGEAIHIVQATTEHVKIPLNDLAHLKPLTNEVLELWRALRLQTLYLA
jgi:hypothetical protein